MRIQSKTLSLVYSVALLILLNVNKMNGQTSAEGKYLNTLLKDKNFSFKKGLFLFIDTQFHETNSSTDFTHCLYLINNSDSSYLLPTYENNLLLKAEILDRHGKWKLLEDETQENSFTNFCGNSFFHVKLDSGMHWVIKPSYPVGNYSTKLRYVLQIENPKTRIVSNEVNAMVQFQEIQKKEESQKPVNAQVINPSNAGANATLAVVAMNVVYKGIPNLLSVSVPGVQANRVFLTCSIGSLIKQSKPWEYVWQLDTIELNPSRNLEIKVFKKMSFGRAKEVSTMHFRIRSLPEPSIQFGSIAESGTYSRGEIRAANFVICPLKNFCYYGISFTTQSYKLIIIPTKGEQQEFSAKGSRLTQEMKDAMDTIQSGDKLIIKEVNAMGPQGPVLIHESLEIQVR